MREENVTILLIEWLKMNNWKIVAFDYPGSGTGIRLHKNGTRFKNKDTIVPDIVAVRDDVALFFENKDRFYKKDFEKQNCNITDNLYSDDVDELLKSFKSVRIRWGIGIPEAKYTENVQNHEYLVDFLYTVDEDGIVYTKKAY